MSAMKSHLTVVAACIRRAQEVLLCQRNENDAFGLLWEFPGGKVEAGESLPEAIVREIEEELGVRIQPENTLGVFEDENESLKITVHLIGARIAAGDPAACDCRDFKWVEIRELDSFDLAPVDKKIAAFLREK